MSDEDTIKDWLEESDEYYSIDFIDDRRNDGYWVIKQIYETKINDKGGDFEDKIRNRIIRMVDNYVDELIDIQFKPLIDNDCEITEDNKYDIESIFMSYRNVIAGTEWDGRRREYEKYNK